MRYHHRGKKALARNPTCLRRQRLINERSDARLVSRCLQIIVVVSYRQRIAKRILARRLVKYGSILVRILTTDITSRLGEHLVC